MIAHRYKYPHDYTWVNELKTSVLPTITYPIRGCTKNDVCPPTIQNRLKTLLQITLEILATECQVDLATFMGLALSTSAIRFRHPALRFNGLIILVMLSEYLRRQSVKIWQAKATVRIWREICCNKNGYPYPRRAKHQFDGPMEFLTFSLPLWPELRGWMPSLDCQRALHVAVRTILDVFAHENGIDYRIGYSCADHLGGSPEYALWHKHVSVGIIRLYDTDRQYLDGVMKTELTPETIWPFLRAEPLWLDEAKLKRMRLLWNGELQCILGRPVSQEKYLITKRQRKRDAVQTKERDTGRLANYNSAVTRDPWRYTFKISKGYDSVLLAPREGVEWRNKPKGAFLEPFTKFIEDRLLAPLALGMRRSKAGYMHHRDAFYPLMVKAQELRMLEETPDSIVAQGKAAAKACGWEKQG